MSPLEKKLIKLSHELIYLPQSRFKHWTYLVRRNKIVNISWNHSSKTHPKAKQFNYKFSTIHSELKLLDVADRFKEEFHRLSVYNVRINNTDGGQIALSAPCPNCQKVLRFLGCKNVRFTGNDGKFHTMEL